MMNRIREQGLLRHPRGVVWVGGGVLVILAVALALLWKAEAPPAAGAASSAFAGAEWREDLGAALGEAAGQQKPVLAYFTADWCPPCRTMKQEVWPREEVRQRLREDYIAVVIDVDRSRNAAAVQRYGIRGIPTILVLNAEGEVQQAGGFMPLPAMLQFLDQASSRG